MLYDEPHPLGEEIGALQAYDLVRSPDMLLIMGTSLKVHGLKKVVKAFAKAVHARKGTVVFVNATPPTKEWEGVIDIHVHGETDVWVHKVEEEWRRVRPQDWQLQTRLDGEVVKEIPRNKGKGKAKGERALGGDVADHGQPPTGLQDKLNQHPCSSPLHDLRNLQRSRALLLRFPPSNRLLPQCHPLRCRLRNDERTCPRLQCPTTETRLARRSARCSLPSRLPVFPRHRDEAISLLVQWSLSNPSRMIGKTSLQRSRR